MEVQLLHYKEEHTNISEALTEGTHDSLAMLSIFLSVSKHFTHTSMVFMMLQVDLASLISVPTSMDDIIESLDNISREGYETRVNCVKLVLLN